MPMPSMTVSTGPSGAKPMKLSMALRNIQRTPSQLNRLKTSWDCSCAIPSMTVTLVPDRTADAATTASAISAKSVTGSGKRLPISAIRCNWRTTKLSLGGIEPGDSGTSADMGCSLSISKRIRLRLSAYDRKITAAPESLSYSGTSRRLHPLLPNTRATEMIMSSTKTMSIGTTRQGLHEITDRIQALVTASGVASGLCTVFIQHTSASLTIQENADPSARRDLEAWMARHVPRSEERRVGKECRAGWWGGGGKER